MYKKRSSVCLMMSIVFTSYAMKSEYELVLMASDNESALVTALQELDDAYKTREQFGICSSLNLAEIKTAIRARKQEYYDLVAKKRTEVVLDEAAHPCQYWHKIDNLNLSDKGLKTALFVMPNYITPANIKYLNLAKNNLKELPLSLLAKTMSNLETLNVSDNNISHVSTHGSKLPRLKHLMLSHNKINAIDLMRLLEKCPLEVLDLSHNPLETVMTDRNESTWNVLVNKDLAIDVRDTKLSREDIEFLKKYCLVGVRNSFKVPCCGVFVGMSGFLSGMSFVVINMLTQQASWATLVGGIALGTTVAGAVVYVIYRKDVAEHKEFHAIRYDDKEVEEENAEQSV